MIPIYSSELATVFLSDRYLLFLYQKRSYLKFLLEDEIDV